MHTIEYVTHASLLFRGDGLSLLTDPFYWFEPNMAAVAMHFPARDIRAEDFGRLNFVYISHAHEDHVHPPTLTRLRDQIDTILLPADRPQLPERIVPLGFKDIRILNNGETVELADGLRVTSYWSDTVDTCLVVEFGGKKALHLNDCLLTAEAAARLAESHSIDYAFVLHTSQQELFPHLLPYEYSRLDDLAREREEAWVAQQVTRIQQLRPRMVIPYSMTVTWHQPEQIHLNGLQRRIPPEFAAAVRQAMPEVGLCIMQPGDVLDMAQGTLCTPRERSDWGQSLAEYQANLVRYLESHPRPSFAPGRVSDIETTLQRRLEKFVTNPLPQTPLGRILRGGVNLQVEGEDGPATFFIDPVSRKVYRRSGHLAAVEITLPANLLGDLLEDRCDAFSLLYRHRTRFHLNLPGTVAPMDEFLIYLGTFLEVLYDHPGVVPRN